MLPGAGPASASANAPPIAHAAPHMVSTHDLPNYGKRAQLLCVLRLLGGQLAFGRESVAE